MILSVYVNGVPASTEEIGAIAFGAFAHFTAMQVRGGRVRGLDLHLERLRRGSDELFGRHEPDDRIMGYLHDAVAHGPTDCSLVCALTYDGAAGIDVWVRQTAPASVPAGPLALDVASYQRPLAHVKHVGEVGKRYYAHRARAAGFDDAAFRDMSGRLTEATIWNLAFWDGERVLWPRGDTLDGVTQHIVGRQLHFRGVEQLPRDIREGDLGGLAAVVMNSWTPAVAVSRLGSQALPVDTEFVELLHLAYAEEPLVTL